MKNKNKEIKKNKVADITAKKVDRDSLWRYRAGRRSDTIII